MAVHACGCPRTRNRSVVIDSIRQAVAMGDCVALEAYGDFRRMRGSIGSACARLIELIGYVPPAEFEVRYYEQAAVA